MDLRHPKWVDLNSAAGNSWWGLTRKQAKSLAVSLIIFSLLLMSPPGIPDFTDVLNLTMARWISSYFGYTNIVSLAITYTIIPWIIFALGIWIYPLNTVTVFNGYMNKAKKYMKKLIENPILFGGIILLGYYGFKVYLKILGG